MGKFADLQLAGILCMDCEVYVGNSGFPTYCEDCTMELRRDYTRILEKIKAEK